MVNIHFTTGFGKTKIMTFNGWIGFCQYRKFWKKEIGSAKASWVVSKAADEKALSRWKTERL